MFEKVFDDHYEEAKVIIEIGDYRITMDGRMRPPIINNEQFYDYDFYSPPKMKESKVDMTVKSPRNIRIEQVRWTVPIAINPRIEE